MCLFRLFTCCFSRAAFYWTKFCETQHWNVGELARRKTLLQCLFGATAAWTWVRYNEKFVQIMLQKVSLVTCLVVNYKLYVCCVIRKCAGKKRRIFTSRGIDSFLIIGWLQGRIVPPISSLMRVIKFLQHLDRTFLASCGLSDPLVLRIYRALYVYSIGMFELFRYGLAIRRSFVVW